MKTYLILFGAVFFMFLDCLIVPDLISDSDNVNVGIAVVIIVLQVGYLIDFILRKIKGAK